jgi:hypothetical protein
MERQKLTCKIQKSPFDEGVKNEVVAGFLQLIWLKNSHGCHNINQLGTEDVWSKTTFLLFSPSLIFKI